MSRFRRLIHSVVSGYATLAVSIVYALASIPLALHYLSPEQFGLWALMSYIGNYLSLVDLGMAGSVARLLIDHKDDRAGGTYGSLIQTGALVTVAQGVIVTVVGFLIAPLLSDLMKIETPLQTEFVSLMRWQVAVLGFTFAVRIFSHVLTAHQRMDITNYGQTAGLVVNFTVQWIFFHAGAGVFSLVWGFMIAVFFNAILLFIACKWLLLFPVKGKWGRASWRYFRELFNYGKDLFLVALGTQLVMASQSMIIQRRLGLEATAAWAVGTKAFNMVYQLISKIIAFSMPAFSEMIVRGERSKLKERFKDVVILSASSAGFCAVAFAICNSTLVHLLSHGKFSWATQDSVLLGVWLLVLAVLGCHNNLVLATKQVDAMRFIYFIEGAVFVATAWIASRWGGVSAIIVSSIVCSSVFTCAYGIRRSSRYFDVSVREISFVWLIPMWRVILFFGPIGWLTWLATRSLGGQGSPRAHDILRLAIVCAVSGTIGVAILISQGLPPSLRNELLARFLARTSKPVSGWFQRLFNYR